MVTVAVTGRSAVRLGAGHRASALCFPSADSQPSSKRCDAGLTRAFLPSSDTLPQNHSLLLTDVRRGEVASTLSHAAGRTSERAARTRPSNDVSSAISK